MKKTVIIGGGIAGLNAGIELLQHGHEVVLCEKNPNVGGLCYGYFVDGYSIDACLHWLMGTKPKTTLNTLWRNIDALNDDVEVSHLPYFCSFIYDGVTVTFGRDLKEEEARWKEISPEDDKAIEAFFESVAGMVGLWNLTQAEDHPKLSMELISSLPKPGPVLKAIGQTRKDYAKAFKHLALRFAIENAMTGYNNAFFFLLVYGLFAAGDGDVPFGGAYAMVHRIKERFLSLGGQLRVNSPVTKLETTLGRVKAAIIDGDRIEADYFIAALDPHILFHKLLENKRLALTYSRLDKQIANHTISSCFCVYVKVAGFQGDISTPTAIQIPKTQIGKAKFTALLVRPYAFDPLVQKEGGTVVSLFVDQDQDDYAQWQKQKDPQKEKERCTEELVKAFLDFYPQYRGKTEVLSSFGPLELHDQTGTSYGSIQSYSFTPKGAFYSHSGTVWGLDNLYFCGQWNRAIGGTPTALLTSHETVKKLLRAQAITEKGEEILAKITFQK